MSRGFLLVLHCANISQLEEYLHILFLLKALLGFECAKLVLNLDDATTRVETSQLGFMRSTLIACIEVQR